VSQCLRIDDKVLSGHRSHGQYLAKGGNLPRMVAELYGKASGCSRGIGGSQHLIDLECGFLGSAPILSSTLAIGVGVGWALRHRGTDAVSVVYFGDAATEEGVFHEAMSFASLHALPVLFICENNGYSTHAPLSVRQPDRPISRLGLAHNVPGVELDGNDVVAVRNAAMSAVDRARAGGGPTFLVCETYRWLEHVGPNSDTHLGYRTEAEVNEWKLRDPLVILRDRLRESHPDWAALEETFDAEIAVEVEDAFAFALRSTFPDPSELFNWVYADVSGEQ
jgi:pyruvate dehydrogenase E1 component alpha subunit